MCTCSVGCGEIAKTGFCDSGLHAILHPVSIEDRIRGSALREFFTRNRDVFVTRYWSPITTKYWYRIATRFSGDDLLFLCWGYEEDPPLELALAESDEPDRYFIQLYHTVATQADIAGKRVLEVSCGHGGGASYLTRSLQSASYTGLDLNPEGVEFCRGRHHVPGLDFVQGNAENLPFADQSFDVVINIEASHCYPHLPRFLEEVARVLSPGGRFLYADVRARDRVAAWEKELKESPMRLSEEADISEQVARGVDANVPRLREIAPRILSQSYTTRLFTAISRKVKSGELSYRMYSFEKE